MNTLENKIQEDLKSSMKSRNTERTECLKMVKTAFMELKTAVNGIREPEDSDLIKVLQKLAKQRKETSSLYRDAGRNDLADKEQKEYEIISEYLPKMMSETETKELVESTILQLGVSSMKDMGKVMGFINKKYAGQIDGSVVAKFVKEKLS